MPPAVRFVLRSVTLVVVGVAFGGIFAALLATLTQLWNSEPLQELANTSPLSERANDSVSPQVPRAKLGTDESAPTTLQVPQDGRGLILERAQRSPLLYGSYIRVGESMSPNLHKPSARRKARWVVWTRPGMCAQTQCLMDRVGSYRPTAWQQGELVRVMSVERDKLADQRRICNQPLQQNNVVT